MEWLEITVIVPLLFYNTEWRGIERKGKSKSNIEWNSKNSFQVGCLVEKL
jgi:hypothetical protein